MLENEVELIKESHLEVVRIYLGFGHMRGLDSVDTTTSLTYALVYHDCSKEEKR